MQQQLEELVKSHPRSDAALQLALLHLRQRDFPAAQRIVKQALKDKDGGPEPLILAAGAVAAQGAGAYEDAANLCRRLRSRRRVRLAAFLLANVWLAKGDVDAIHAVVGSLPEVGPDFRVAYDELLASEKDRREGRPRLALLLNLAELFRRAGWTDQGVGAAEEARRLVYKNIVVDSLVARCYAAAGRSEEELKQREKGAREHPDSAAAALDLARAHADRGQLAQGIEVCQRFLERSPHHVGVLLLSADLSLRRGDHPAAVSRSRRALGRDSRNAAALRLLLEALLATEKFREAAEAIRGLERTAPMFVPGPFERAILAIADDRLDEALEQCEVGLRRSSLDFRLRFLAGVVLERKGDLAGAVRHFEVVHLVRANYQPVRRRLARAAMGAGRVALALNVYRDAVAARPDDLALRLEFAAALSHVGRHKDAVVHLRSLAPKDAADRCSVEARIAQEFLLLRDAPRALAIAEAVLLDQPTHALARRVAMRASRRLGDLPGAVRICERILAKAPQVNIDAELGILCLLQLRPKGAAQRLGRAAARAEGARRAGLLKWQAAAELALGATQAAGAAAEEALASLPSGGTPSEILVIVLSVAGSDAKARDEVARMEKSTPEPARWLKAALSRFKQDRGLAATAVAAYAASAHRWHRRAVQLFAAARKRVPDEPLLLRALALAQRDAGLLEQAVASARELVRLRPSSGTAHFVLGRMLDAQGQADAALEAYQRAAKQLGKEDLTAWVSIAQRFGAAERVDEAIEAYGVVLALDPDNSGARNNLAWLYASHRPGQLAEAERLASVAVRQSPKVASFHDTLGWVYFLRRRYDDAKRELKTALGLAPRKAVFHYHMGMVYFAEGLRERARRALRHALGLDPSFPGAETARAMLKLLEHKAAPPETEPKPAERAP